MDIRDGFSETLVLECMYFCQASSGFTTDHGAGHLDPTMSFSGSDGQTGGTKRYSNT